MESLRVTFARVDFVFEAVHSMARGASTLGWA